MSVNSLLQLFWLKAAEDSCQIAGGPAPGPCGPGRGLPPSASPCHDGAHLTEDEPTHVTATIRLWGFDKCMVSNSHCCSSLQCPATVLKPPVPASSRRSALATTPLLPGPTVGLADGWRSLSKLWLRFPRVFFSL